MRLIPVIDVRHGVAVHAVAGQRETYQAIRSVLTSHTEPVQVAADLYSALDNRELYVADLDSIERGSTNGAGPITLSPAVVTTLQWAAETGVTVLLDAGLSSPIGATALVAPGNVRLVAGTETLTRLATLGEIMQVVDKAKLVASLDTRDGHVLSQAPELHGVTPEQAAGLLIQQGIGELIVLDLSRVGTGSGTANGLIGKLAARYPDVALLVGGGVRSVADVDELARHGAAGVLVATALHTGAITVEEWRSYAN